MNTYVRDYGVTPDEQKVQTLEIQQAIDDCAASGGGTIFFDAGTYRTGTLYIRSNTYLNIPYMCTIKGSDDLADYNDPHAWPQNTPIPFEYANGKHLIVILEAENCGIYGGGCINGNGSYFGYRAEPGFSRPSQMVYLCESKNIRLSNLELINSPYWSCFVHGCEDVIITGLHITNNPDIHNGDGLDIDTSRRVVVSDCIIHTEDDCITLRGDNSLLGALKDPTKILEDVTITNCQLSSRCNAVRIGVGNSVIRNVRISNMIIRNSSKGVCMESRFYFNTDEKPGCRIENISFNNVYMECMYPIFLSAHCSGINDEKTSDIRNIQFSNLTIAGKSSIMVQGNENSLVENVSFNNVVFECLDNELFREMESRSAKQYRCIDKYGYGEWDFATSPAAFFVANIKNFALNDVTICIDETTPFELGMIAYNTEMNCNNLRVTKGKESIKQYEIRG